jgi:hypothetical protein
VPVEETLLVDVHDQDVVAVDHFRDARGPYRVRPTRPGSGRTTLADRTARSLRTKSR